MFEQAIGAMASVIVDPYLLGLIFATTILGVIIGVLPGLGATTGAALLLPFTLTMDPVHAIAVLATIYVSATFAGSITAILINTPGTSAAAVLLQRCQERRTKEFNIMERCCGPAQEEYKVCTQRTENRGGREHQCLPVLHAYLDCAEKALSESHAADG